MKKKAIHPLPSTPRRSAADTGLEALAWAVSSGASEKVVQNLQTMSRRRLRRKIAAASAAAMLLICGMAWQLWLRPSAPTLPTPSSALVTAPVRQVLPDGSIVDLKDGAAIQTEFTPEFRRVALQNGEAHFQVTKNRARPFIVVAGGIEVRAVGTAFSVDRGSRTVEVLVTEGRVTVDKPVGGGTSGQPYNFPAEAPALQTIATLDAGKRVVIEIAAQGASPTVLAVSAVEQKDRLSWRVPRLEFSGMALRDAIPMFNKAGGTHFVLNPSLGDLQMSGVLRADDVDSLLMLLKNEFGIDAVRLADGEILLSRP